MRAPIDDRSDAFGKELAMDAHKLAGLETPCGVLLSHPDTITALNSNFAHAYQLLHKREGNAWARLRKKPVEPGWVRWPGLQHCASHRA